MMGPAPPCALPLLPFSTGARTDGSGGAPKRFRRVPAAATCGGGGGRRGGGALATTVSLCLGMSAALVTGGLLLHGGSPMEVASLLTTRRAGVADGGIAAPAAAAIVDGATAAAAAAASVRDAAAADGAAAATPATTRQTLAASVDAAGGDLPSPLEDAAGDTSRRGTLFRELMAARRAALEDPHPAGGGGTLGGGKAHYLVECVLVKRGGDILREHIVRNGLAGVDHFYIFDDNGNVTASGADGAAGATVLEEDLAAVLSVFDPSIYTHVRSVDRRVTADPVTDHVQVQRRTYHHCAKEYGPSTTWMAFVDTDEFFETAHVERFSAGADGGPAGGPSPNFGEVPFMRLSLARQQATAPAVPVRWDTALTNGRQLPPPDGSSLAAHFPATCVVEGNPRALRDFKTVVQPASIDFDDWFVARNFYIHGVKDVRVRSLLGQEGVPFAGEAMPDPAARVEWYEIRHRPPWAAVPNVTDLVGGADHTIVHYWSRDLLSYARKMGRGRPNNGLGKGGPRTFRDLLKRERACTAVGRVASVAARLPVVHRYLDDLPRLDARALWWLDDERDESEEAAAEDAAAAAADGGGDGDEAAGETASETLAAVAGESAKARALVRSLRRRMPLDAVAMCTRLGMCEVNAAGRRLVPEGATAADVTAAVSRQAAPGADDAAVFPYAWIKWYYHPTVTAEQGQYVDTPLPPRRYY